MYPHKEIEQKWQNYWKANNTFQTQDPQTEDNPAKKCYVLDMFPYPSGA